MSLAEAVVGLVSLPDNPAPPGAVVSMVVGRGRLPLRVARWPAITADPRGTVVLVPGRAEFIEKYFEVIGELLARGFAVATFDLRGQGGSGRLGSDPMHGHVASFHDYVADLEKVIDHAVKPHLPAPYFGLGHSTGGTVLLLGIRRLQRVLARIVATAPLLGLPPTGMPDALAGVVLDLAVLAGRHKRPVSRRRPGAMPEGTFAGNPLTSDPARYARTRACVAAAPELRLGPPTLGWVRAARDAGIALRKPEVVARIGVPALLFACGADRVVSGTAIELLGRRLPAGGGTILVPGARHELMMESDRYRGLFWAGFDAFVPGGG